MKRYPEYKESGVEFIGEIPAHWEVKKLRYFCSMKSGNGFSHDLQGKIGLEVPFFKVADTNTPENKVEMLYAHNTVSLQEVSDFKFILHKPNSIVFPKVGAALLLNKRNILSQRSCIDNNMMSLYSNQSNYKFLYYAMLNVDFKRHYRAGGTVPSINESEVGNIPIVYPTHSEQTQIANFLDRKTGQIDELIRIKERLLELLAEQRTVLINESVTKGLDPNVEMKPSGVEWIGEIPKHWKIVRGKFILSHKKEINSDFQCNNLLSLTLNGVLRKDMNSAEGLIPGDYRTYQVFYPDNLVFKLIDLENIQTSRVGIVPEKGIMSPVYIRLEGNSDSYERYYFYQYYDLYKQHIFNFLGKGVRSSLSPSNLLEIPLAFPPLSEQKAIGNFLDQKTKQIDELISAEQRKVELLKEYRQSLISEVVTGKIDVRSEV